MNNNLTSLVAVAFTPSVDITNKLELVSKISERSSNVLDGDPVLLPVPNDAPLEIPRIILSNKENTKRLNIGLNRIEYIADINNRGQAPSTNSAASIGNTYKAEFAAIIAAIKDETSMRVTRLGFIPSYTYMVETGASQVIKDALIKDKAATKEIHDVNIGILKKVKIAEINSNAWFYISANRQTNDKDDDKKVGYRFDINTLPETVLNLDETSIENYIDGAFKYIIENERAYLL